MARRGKKNRGKQQRKREKRIPEAKTADKHALYEDAVQDPDGDIEMMREVFTKAYGREPRLMREDFCGTAHLATQWVRKHEENRAIGIDLDPDPLGYGREHHIAKLDEEQRKRIELVEANVMDAKVELADVTCAFNFSYFIFRERKQLIDYFRTAHAGLKDEGVFVVDLYGGADAQRTMTERRDCDDFDYIWDQNVFDPITHRVVNYIHFRFRDRSRIDKAFRYEWRLWSIPEVREALLEAGFRETIAYWEGTDEDGEGDGNYFPAESAPDDPAWVTYIAALR